MRLAFWPSVVTLPLLIALLALGTWQLERRAWKEALIAERTAHLAAPPITLAEAGRIDIVPEYLRITVEGTFLHNRELYLSTTSRGGELGFRVLTPLRTRAGPLVLVNRGWVPPDRKLPASREPGQLTGSVVVAGLVRRGGRPSLFTPDNHPDENVWYWIDLPAMSRALGVEVAPFIVAAGPAPNPGGLPVGGQTRSELTNDHLQYAIAWYALAGALLVIYALYHRRRPQGDNEAT